MSLTKATKVLSLPWKKMRVLLIDACRDRRLVCVRCVPECPTRSRWVEVWCGGARWTWWRRGRTAPLGLARRFCLRILSKRRLSAPQVKSHSTCVCWAPLLDQEGSPQAFYISLGRHLPFLLFQCPSENVSEKMVISNKLSHTVELGKWKPVSRDKKRPPRSLLVTQLDDLSPLHWRVSI